MSWVPSIQPVGIVVSDGGKDKSAQAVGCSGRLYLDAPVLRVSEGSPIIRSLCGTHAIMLVERPQILSLPAKA